jgi:hypothetical protein
MPHSSSSSSATALASIIGRSSSLLLLKPQRLQDTGKFHPGMILSNTNNIIKSLPTTPASTSKKKSQCLVLFSGIDGGNILACDVSHEKYQIQDQDVLETILDSNKDTTGPPQIAHVSHTSRRKKSVLFRPPPTEFERKIITKGWTTGVAAFDAMCPLGKGQSMVFIDEKQQLSNNNPSLLQDIVSNLVSGTDILGSPLMSIYSLTSVQKTPAFNLLFDKELFLPGTANSAYREDPDVLHFLYSYAACALGEQDRDMGKDAFVAIHDLSSFQRIWDRVLTLVSANNIAQDRLFQPRRHRGELRMFYSNLVQRAANMSTSQGGGSLTLCVGFPGQSSTTMTTMNKNKTLTDYKISLDDLRHEVNQGLRPNSDIDRLTKLLHDRKVELTADLLQKLNIKLPIITTTNNNNNNSTSIITTPQQMHIEELMSLCDGHCTTSDHDGGFRFDPRRSLTRIGAGRLQNNDVRDTRSPMLRSVARGLRLEVADLLASVSHDNRVLGQLEQWRKILNDSSRNPKRHATLIWGVREGWKTLSGHVIDDIVQEVDLNKEADEQSQLVPMKLMTTSKKNT